MESGISCFVLYFQIWIHRKSIGESKLRSGEAGPVKCCTSSKISIVDIHTFNLREIIEGSRLIALSGYLEDACPIDISHMHVCTKLFYEFYAKLQIPMIGCKMESSKIFIRLFVDPLSQLIFGVNRRIFLEVILLGVVQNVLEALLGIFKG